MAQRKVISGDEVANIITSWDTDDELSSDEEDAETQLGSSISSFARPAFIASNSSEDESDDDSNDVTSTGRQEATSSDITGKNGSLWTSSQPALTGRTAAHNVFTASPGVPHSVSCTITTPYDAWKMFIHEPILRSITKFTIDEAVRCGDADFSLTLDELESFIALQYARGVYRKNHLVAFLWSKNYGIPFFGVLVDVKAKYVANITPYLGVQEKEGRCGVPLGESAVIKITEHIKGKGYNICSDNFFTSLPLTEKLQKSKFFLVGTMKKNRRDLSVSMTESQQGGVNSSKCFWHKNSGAMLVRYQTKPKKTVCLLSTMHSTPDVDTTTAVKKPSVISFYNENKVGVDCFDQMARLYTRRSASRRWPLAVWGNIFDIAAINACAIYTKSTGIQLSQRKFTLELIEHLRHHQQENSFPITLTSGPRKCRKCYKTGCNNATTFICSHCQNPTCGKCFQDNSKIVFVKCNGCC